MSDPYLSKNKLQQGFMNLYHRVKTLEQEIDVLQKENMELIQKNTELEGKMYLSTPYFPEEEEGAK